MKRHEFEKVCKKAEKYIDIANHYYLNNNDRAEKIFRLGIAVGTLNLLHDIEYNQQYRTNELVYLHERLDMLEKMKTLFLIEEEEEEGE